MLKKIANLIFSYSILFYVIFLFGCNENSNKNDLTQKIIPKEFKITKGTIGKVLRAKVLDDNLILLDIRDSSLITIIDLDSFHVKKQIGIRGEGPGELVSPYMLNIEEGKSIGVVDMGKKEYFMFNLDSSLNFKNYLPSSIYNFKSLSLHNLLTLDSGSFISTGGFPNGRFGFKKTNSEIKFLLEFPNDGKHQNGKNEIRALAYQGNFCVSRILKRFAYFTFFGGLFEIYTYKNDSILKINQDISHLPEYTEVTQGEIQAPKYERSSKIGYLDVTSNNDFIAALYSGKTVKESLAKGFSANEIIIFDWNGNKTIKFKIDQNISNIIIDEKSRYLYSVVESEEISVLRFDISSFLTKFKN